MLLGAAGVAAISIPATIYYLNNVQYDSSIIEPRSLLLIMEPDSVAVVGEHYRFQALSESSERKLARKVLAGLPERKDEIIPGLEEKVLQDFKTGDTVIVDGWILSATEARQSALFSLNDQKD